MDPAALALPLLVGIVGLALLFDFINGAHDAANAIATVVSTRVLTPRRAVLLAAFFNRHSPDARGDGGHGQPVGTSVAIHFESKRAGGPLARWIARRARPEFAAESGKSLGLRGGSEEWAMQTAIEDGRADLEQAMGAAR